MNAMMMLTSLLLLALLTLTLSQTAQQQQEKTSDEPLHPPQTGPMSLLFGQELHALQMISEKEAQLVSLPSSTTLSNVEVVGIYFSADWCGPCRQFTPDLVKFYEKVNSKKGSRGKKRFEIVWVSRCRDWESFGQYFTQMPWLALPFEDSLGPLGEALSQKYNVKSIPSLVLVDVESGKTITKEARTEIPKDLNGLSFPFRGPVDNFVRGVVPRPVRRLIGGTVGKIVKKVINVLRGAIGMKAI